METRWEYSGDRDITHGGTWYDLSTFEEGYVDAVCVTDLEDAIGFDGAVFIEHVSIVIDVTQDERKRAMDRVGQTEENLASMDAAERNMAVAHALLDYGHFDLDDSWDGYRLGASETLQTKRDGSMAFDSMKADKRVLAEHLDGYIKSVHLKE